MSDEQVPDNEQPPVVPDDGATDLREDVGSEEVVASPVEVERDAYRDTAQRLQADFENYRKRMIKQQGEVSERANESLVVKLLPVLDTIDLAKSHEPSGNLEQISSSLLDVLTKEGLERIASVDQPFDPNKHEAVAHQEGTDEPKVGEELRAGYMWKGRVIRPAMVTVIG